MAGLDIRRFIMMSGAVRRLGMRRQRMIMKEVNEPDQAQHKSQSHGGRGDVSRRALRPVPTQRHIDGSAQAGIAVGAHAPAHSPRQQQGQERGQR